MSSETHRQILNKEEFDWEGNMVQMALEHSASTVLMEVNTKIMEGWFVRSMVSYHQYQYGESGESNNVILVVYESKQM